MADSSKYDGVFRGALYALTVFFSIFQLVFLYLRLPSMVMRSLHLAMGMGVVFLSIPLVRPRRLWSTIIDLLFAAAALFTGLYTYLYYVEIAHRTGRPIFEDLVVGFITVVLVLETGRRTLGWVLPAIGIAFLTYALFGNHLPGYFAHRGYSLRRVLAQLTMGSEGLWGMALGVSASFVYLFILFGSLLNATGGGKFLIELSMAVFGRVRGGIAKVAVLASALFGTISGTGTGNVVATGSITIPMMISGGYKRHVAGAIECVASTGGPMLPPMMAAAAFLIPEFIGATYRDVIIAATIPALLFFWTTFWMIDFHAAKTGKVGLPRSQCPQLRYVFKDGWHFLLAIGVIVYMLVVRRSTPTMAAINGIFALAILSVIKPAGGMKRSIGTYVSALHKTAMNARMVITACAVAGIVMGVVSLTGLGLAFSARIGAIAGDSMLILLLIAMVGTIFLGMGIPPTPAYIIVAITIAPALIRMGVPPMAAHLFVFWFGMMALITPPICTAVYASVGISEAKLFPTAVEAMKLGCVGFFIPFVYVFRPPLLMNGTPWQVLFALMTFAIGGVALAAGIQGYFRVRLGSPTRILFLATGGTLVFPSVQVNIVGYAFLAAALAATVYETRKKQAASVLPAGSSDGRSG